MRTNLRVGLRRTPWLGGMMPFFGLLDWNRVAERTPERAWPGPRPHPRAAYIKALLVKLREGKGASGRLGRLGPGE
jgi:hypothetical protein